jgi:hypothetical protein
LQKPESNGALQSEYLELPQGLGLFGSNLVNWVNPMLLNQAAKVKDAKQPLQNDNEGKDARENLDPTYKAGKGNQGDIPE